MKTTFILIFLGIAITAAGIVSFLLYEFEQEQIDTKRITEDVKKIKEYIQLQKEQTRLDIDNGLPH